MNFCSVAYTIYEFDYRVRRYGEALLGRGGRVDAIALRRDGQERTRILNGVKIFQIQTRKYDERGLLDYIFRIALFFVKGSLILFFKHLRYRYRVIHIHNVPDFLVFMAFIPKLLGAKIILDIHDILPEFYCQKFNRSMDTCFANLLRLIEKVSIHFADHVIVGNDLWRGKIISRDNIEPRRITTSLNYPNINFFRKSPNMSKNASCTILYPGTISHHHGIDIAIRALSIAKKEIPTLRFLISKVPKSLTYYNSLKVLIRSLHLEQNVEFFQPVPPEELWKIYAKTLIGVVPKRKGIFSSEAFSTKILDFMAAGIPVIASRTKIDEYYFDDSMIMFFESESPEALARCIIELYQNPEKAGFLAANAKQFVAQNNWDVKKQKYIDLVNSLVASIR